VGATVWGSRSAAAGQRSLIRFVCPYSLGPTFRIMPRATTKTDALLGLARKGPLQHGQHQPKPRQGV